MSGTSQLCIPPITLITIMHKADHDQWYSRKNGGQKTWSENLVTLRKHRVSWVGKHCMPICIVCLLYDGMRWCKQVLWSGLESKEGQCNCFGMVVFTPLNYKITSGNTVWPLYLINIHVSPSWKNGGPSKCAAHAASDQKASSKYILMMQAHT